MAKNLLSAVVGGLAAAIAIWLLQGHSFELWPNGMSFSDLSAVLLGASALILAVLGAVLAIAAFWGYTQFAKYIQASVIDHIEKDETIGLIKESLRPKIAEYMHEQLNEGHLKKILEQRVDAIIFRGSELEEEDTQTDTESE